MKFFTSFAAVAASSLALASGATTLYPAGVDPSTCINYPFCGVASPAALPVPVINGRNVAPVLNTLPDQTAFYQDAQLVRAPAALPTPIINNQPVAPTLNTVPAQTNAHEEHLLISQQQQLQQLIDAQTIQIRAQQQQIEAERHFGRL